MIRKRKKWKMALKITLFIIIAFLIPSPVSMAMKGFALCVLDAFTGTQAKAVITFNQQEAVNTYLENTEEIIINKFQSEGGTVIITEDENILKGSDGVYLRKKGISTIYLKKKLFYWNPAVLHELGHCLDGSDYNLSSAEEFKKVAEKEVTNFSIAYLLYSGRPYASSHYKKTGSYSEYFAEAYCSYKVFPHMLKMAAPETYMYFNQLLGDDDL